MAVKKQLKRGTRVRIPEPAVPLEREALTGSVLGPDIWDDYYLIELDRPARYHHASGEVEELTVIREMEDNLQVIEPAKRQRASGAERRA